MKYTSPFHLLPVRDTQALTTDGLKRWKKELMLQFDLNQNSVIEINGEEHDKNDVLKAFDLLKDKPEYHWRLYENKPLLDFIEEEDIDFFKDRKNWVSFQDISYREWLAQWFIPTHDNVVYKCIDNENDNALFTLINVCNSEFTLPDTWLGAAYAKTYGFFTNLLAQTNRFYNQRCFTYDGEIELLPEIHEYINLHYIEVMGFLPEEFEHILWDYAFFAHHIADDVFKEMKPLRNIERKSLKTLKKALQIDVQVRGDEWSMDTLAEVETYFEIPKAHSELKKGFIIWLIGMIIMFVLFRC